MANFLMSQSYLKKKYDELKAYSRENDTECPALFTFMDELSKVFTFKEYTKGELLFHFGEEGKELIFVLSGQIECVIPKTDGDKNRALKSTENDKRELVKTGEYEILERDELIQQVSIV